MRVLHVIPSVASSDGGPTVAVRAMAAALSDQGATVTIATTDANGGGRLRVPLGRPVREGAVEYIYFPHQLRGWKFSWGLTRWLAAHVATFDVVEVHACFSYSAIPACREARRAGVPYVVRPLGTLDAWSLNHRSWKKRPYYQLLERSHLVHAAAVHCTSQAEADAVSALGFGDRACVIPLGVAIPEALTGAHGTANPPRILFLSRLHVKKGVELLLDALAVLKRDMAFDAVIAGQGDARYEQQLRDRAIRAGIADRVRFVGHVEGQAKAQLLAGSDIFVLPSSQENFGIAVAEAMAAGVPVITTGQVALAPDLLAAEAGLVVPRDVGALAEAIRMLLTDGAARSRMGGAGRRLAMDRLSWDACARALLGLYNAICEHGPYRRADKAGIRAATP